MGVLRPPRSNWRSSPLSPNDGDIKQRWHKRYGRCGRRYETTTPEGPSAIEDYGPWEHEYRCNLYDSTNSLRGLRGLAHRAIPVFDFGRSSNQEIRADDKAIDVEEFLGSLSGPWPQNDGAGSSSEGAAGASGSTEAEEEDESEDTRARYTAAEKGKQREGEPVLSSPKGPSALKPAAPDKPQSLAPEMPTRGLRLPPRRLFTSDDNDEDISSVQNVEHAGAKSEGMARSSSQDQKATEKLNARKQLKEARRKINFAAELPLDGLGVVYNKTPLPQSPLERIMSPSSIAMERTQSQMRASGPSSRAGSVMMERTPSRARALGPSSQENVDLVAEPNQRLEDLSPYSCEDKVPDTPMPEVETGDDDEEPPPSPQLPPSESGDASDGDVPRLGISEPYHAPILRKKRDASEISGGCIPGPSSHRQAPASAARSAMVATMSVNGQERPISYGELRAIDLQPPPSVQKELYKLYAVLVNIVQVAPGGFSVVDPHDFIEVLSWSDSVGAGGSQVVQRVRGQATTPGGLCRKLLVPFCVSADMFLAVIDLGATAFQILEPRTQQDLQSREMDDGFETSATVYDFIRTLYQDQCPRLRAWTIGFEETVQGPVSINEPGIVSGSYVNELGRPIQLRSILPFFFEVLRIVCGVKIRKTVDDDALMTRLFAIFEGSPSLELTNAIGNLRKSSQKDLDDSLKDRITSALDKGVKKIRTGRTLQDKIYLKSIARNHGLDAVRQSHNAVKDLMEQYAQVRRLLEGMAKNCIMTKSSLHHGIASRRAMGWFYSGHARQQIWQPEVALNQFKSQGLNDCAQKFQEMKAELDHWLRMLNQNLDSTKMR